MKLEYSVPGKGNSPLFKFHALELYAITNNIAQTLIEKVQLQNLITKETPYRCNLLKNGNIVISRPSDWPQFIGQYDPYNHKAYSVRIGRDGCETHINDLGIVSFPVLSSGTNPGDAYGDISLGIQHYRNLYEQEPKDYFTSAVKFRSEAKKLRIDYPNIVLAVENLTC